MPGFQKIKRPEKEKRDSHGLPVRGRRRCFSGLKSFSKLKRLKAQLEDCASFSLA
jgi:hypothetical protein